LILPSRRLRADIFISFFPIDSDGIRAELQGLLRMPVPLFRLDY
jgi:hypothetical protein